MPIEKQTLTFVGTMKALSPLAVTEPNPNKPKGENVVWLPKLRVVTKDRRGSAEDGSPVVGVPFLSANSLRGRLRRECAYAVFDRFLAEGVSVPLQTANWMRAGAGRSNKDALPDFVTPMMLEEEVLGSGNIHTGLWGAGLKCPSRIMISDVLPYCTETVEQGLFEGEKAPHDLPSARDITGFRGWVRKNDLNDTNCRENEFFDAAEMEQLIEELKKQQEEKKKKDAKLAAKASGELVEEEAGEAGEGSGDSLGLQQIGAIEYIAPGTVFNVRIRLADVTPAQVGMFLAGLARFADNPIIGGQKRWGFGRVSFTLEDGNGRWILINDAGFTADDFDAEIAAFEAWRDTVALDRLHTIEWLEKQAKPRPVKRGRKARA
jgi:CRISPR type IV-associated protein Csf2